MQQVYLIRHGQTSWNADGRWQGHSDVPLSDEGYAQAQALAHYLAQVPFAAVYTSDLQRARETGRLLAEATGAPQFEDPRLRELHLGVLQGHTHAEIREKYAVDVEQMAANYLDHVITEGESRRARQALAFAAWQEALGQADGRPIALVSHGGTVRLLLLRLLEPDQYDHIMQLPIGNTSWTLLEVDPDGDVRMVSPPSIAHLQREAADTGEGRL